MRPIRERIQLLISPPIRAVIARKDRLLHILAIAEKLAAQAGMLEILQDRSPILHTDTRGIIGDIEDRQDAAGSRNTAHCRDKGRIGHQIIILPEQEEDRRQERRQAIAQDPSRFLGIKHG